MINFLKKLFGIKPKKEVIVEKPVETVDNKPDYYKFLEGEMGNSESKTPERVIWYHSHTSLKKADWKISTSWCASLASTVLEVNGYKSPKTAWARTFLTIQLKLAKPIKFCGMVFERNGPGGDSHVTFWTGEETSTHYLCLGGNQNNSVNKTWYPKKDFLGAFWPEKVEPTPELPKPSVKMSAVWDDHKDGVLFTKITIEALKSKGKRMLAMKSFKDESKYFMKSFATMSEDEKVQAFLMLISAMAWRESNFKTNLDYKEGFTDSKGKPVISKGLLQLSIESVNQSAYGGKIKDPNELWDPAVNLGLTVSILDHWLSKDGYIGTYLSKSEKFGGARYWSCLRDISSSQAKIKEKCLALKF